jgi:DNA mismatch endonuclease (patch repair protein)
MTDPARSAQMARILSQDTKPEMRVRQAMHAAGLRYRLHDRKLPGSPDLVLPSRRLAVQVRGCFFHQHPGCTAARTPKSRLDFWVPKLRGNVERDARKDAELRTLGWDVRTIWECETKRPELVAELVEQVRAFPQKSRRNG